MFEAAAGADDIEIELAEDDGNTMCFIHRISDVSDGWFSEVGQCWINLNERNKFELVYRGGGGNTQCGVECFTLRWT